MQPGTSLTLQSWDILDTSESVSLRRWVVDVLADMVPSVSDRRRLSERHARSCQANAWTIRGLLLLSGIRT